jgi:hypothetical protein
LGGRDKKGLVAKIEGREEEESFPEVRLEMDIGSG